MLHVAVKLLSYEPRCVTDNAFANALLSRFVTQATTLYSHFFMSYNIHALFHLSSDVLRFGPLDNFSAYRFENYYGKMKRHIKKNDKPLQQLFKRLLETAQNQTFVGQNSNYEQITFHNRMSLTCRLVRTEEFNFIEVLFTQADWAKLMEKNGTRWST